MGPIEMTQFVSVSKQNGWRQAVETVVPEYLRATIWDEDRADFRFILPIETSSVVLDAGCAWGAITTALARDCRHIVGMDYTEDVLQFLRVRCEQEGFENVQLTCGDVLSIPFPDESFDLVILNGVLEWVGRVEPYVVHEWNRMVQSDRKRKNKLHKKTVSPQKMQLMALKEVNRVLKKDGSLYLAIENRYGLKYFQGAIDDHSDLRFTNLMPRWFANRYMKHKLGEEYRTYTYSYWGYKDLIRRAGFIRADFYCPIPSYQEPRYIVDLSSDKVIEYFIQNLFVYNQGRRASLSKLRLLKYLVDSYSIIAFKGLMDE